MKKIIFFETRDVLITLTVLIGMNIITVVALIVVTIVMSKRTSMNLSTDIEMATILPTDVGEGKDALSSTGTLTDVKVGGETKTSTANEEEVIYAEISK